MNTLSLSPHETARRRLLDALRREGPMARVELGQHLGMSPASVSDLTANLLDEGILMAEEVSDIIIQTRYSFQSSLLLKQCLSMGSKIPI